MYFKQIIIFIFVLALNCLKTNYLVITNVLYYYDTCDQYLRPFLTFFIIPLSRSPVKHIVYYENFYRFTCGYRHKMETNGLFIFRF